MVNHNNKVATVVVDIRAEVSRSNLATKAVVVTAVRQAWAMEHPEYHQKPNESLHQLTKIGRVKFRISN